MIHEVQTDLTEAQLGSMVEQLLEFGCLAVTTSCYTTVKAPHKDGQIALVATKMSDNTYIVSYPQGLFDKV